MAILEMNTCQGFFDGFMSKEAFPGMDEMKAGASKGWDAIKTQMGALRPHLKTTMGTKMTLADWLSGGLGAATGIAADVASRDRSAKRALGRGEWPKQRGPLSSLLRYLASGALGGAAGVGLSRGSGDLMTYLQGRGREKITDSPALAKFTQERRGSPGQPDYTEEELRQLLRSKPLGGPNRLTSGVSQLNQGMGRLTAY